MIDSCRVGPSEALAPQGDVGCVGFFEHPFAANPDRGYGKFPKPYTPYTSRANQGLRSEAPYTPAVTPYTPGEPVHLLLGEVIALLQRVQSHEFPAALGSILFDELVRLRSDLLMLLEQLVSPPRFVVSVPRYRPVPLEQRDPPLTVAVSPAPRGDTP
jgi:hypothetical protein